MSTEFTRFVILLSSVAGVTTPGSLIRRHVAFLRALDRDGALVLAGPFSNRDGGMIILKVASLDEAQSIAASDPFVQAGARRFEVAVWTLSCEGNNHMGMG